MAEKAARWFRASSDKQDAKNQVKRVDAHIAAKGYEVARTFELQDQSAYHGEQEAELKQVLADLADGKYTVIVTRHSDRLDRRGPRFALPFLWAVTDAGGRIECVDEPSFGNDEDFDGMMTYMAMVKNHKESRDKSARVTDAFTKMRADGALIGRAPFGFEVAGTRKAKTLVPTDLGRQYVPGIFTRCIAGWSLEKIALWLDAEGVPTSTGRPGWHAKSVSQIIRNPSMMGLRCRQDPKTKAYGDILVRHDGIVDAATFAAAGKALDERPHRGLGKAETAERALLAGVIYCPRCDGPMYRIKSGGNKRKDGSTYRTAYYYRCSGSGAHRQGCRNMVPLAKVDDAVHAFMADLTEPIMARKQIPGHNHDSEMKAVKFELQHIDPDAEDYDERHAALRAELARLKTLPDVPATYVDEPTGETYASRWTAQGNTERAAWMKSVGLTAWALNEHQDGYRVEIRDRDGRMLRTAFV